LYGHTDGSWEVREPEQEVPTDQPEPTPGINLVRDSMERAYWLQKVAIHCDSWLARVSFFIGARLLNASGRYIVLLYIIFHSTYKTQNSDYIMQHTNELNFVLKANIGIMTLIFLRSNEI
jgi:hypothetical protein